MARAEIGEIVASRSGRPLSGASVQVNKRVGGTATVYTAETGTGTLTNPLSTDSYGRIEGWLAEGSYDLVVTANGQSYTQRFEATKGGVSGGGSITVTDAAYGADPTGVASSRAAFQAAITACGAAGHMVIPPGTYKIDSALSVTTGFLGIRGSGWGATKINQTFDGDLFVFTAPASNQQCVISDIWIDRSGATTTGSTFKVGGTFYQSIFERLVITNARTCFKLGNTGTDVVRRNTIRDIYATVVDGGKFLEVGATAADVQDFTLDRCTAVATGGAHTSSVAVSLDPTTTIDQFTIRDCYFGQFWRGMRIAGNGSFSISDWAVDNVLFDGCIDNALLIEPTGNTVSRGRFRGCWFASNAYTMLVRTFGGGTVFDLQWGGSQFLNQTAANSANVANGSELYWYDCDFYDAGNALANLDFAASLTRFGVIDCRLGAKNVAQPGAGFGIRVGATCTDYVLQGNDVSKNPTPISVAVSSLVSSALISNNRGYNPPGAMVSPSVPLTTVFLTNPFPFDCQVLIAGGTLTAVNMKGTNGTSFQVGTTAGMYQLARGGQIAITYTVAPTWTWFGTSA